MTTKAEFFREMNKHGHTSYRCVNETYIVEYGHGPLTEQDHITVWRHERDGAADESKGEESLPHEWVKVTRAFGSPDEMERLWATFTTEASILAHRDGYID